MLDLAAGTGKLAQRLHALGFNFTVVVAQAWHWFGSRAAADLRTLAASRSHTLTLPEPERDALLGAVDDLTRTHPELVGQDHVHLPYRTECWRAQVR